MRSCVECQYRSVSSKDENNDSVGEDCFHIRCEHPNQENTVGFTAKTKNKYGKIYFRCPELGWEDKVLDYLKRLQENEDYEYDQELQELIDEKEN